MVMVDRILKGVIDPSSIWTLICMLVNRVNGNEAYGMSFTKN